MKRIGLIIFTLLCIFTLTSEVFALEASDCNNLNEQLCKSKGCYWNFNNNTCTADLQYVTCGGAKEIPAFIPAFIPSLTSFAVTAIKYVVPIVLIITSLVSMAKAMTSSSAEEAMKVKGKIISKFVAALLVFLVISITQFVILKAADNSEKSSIRACFNCFLNNNCN